MCRSRRIRILQRAPIVSDASPWGEAAADTAASPGVADGSLGALAAGPAAGHDAERRRQEAFDAAWRFLGHRERTEAEVRARLARNDVEPELIEEVLGELRAGSYVDDAGFARR